MSRGANALGLRLIGAWCRRLYQAGCDGGSLMPPAPATCDVFFQGTLDGISGG
ncbi:hypothetical protein GXY_14832 [Novacetimonas hansenii ATCC 23769]|uniref:Uncharacterized protein n=1 Tax=Novacetimonas hansenii ATCC 23769 TaxID=714995 RepID=D5QII5_NOVHA|nr:hypothetical protein GXY_14832 [Novacetimonas hansenii ATCC 23769]